MSGWDDVKRSFQSGNTLTRLIYVNVGVFLIIKVIAVLGFLFQSSWDAARPFTLPAALNTFIQRPWAIFSYMFLHVNFMHLFFNLLWLYFGGQIFLNFLSSRKLLSTYLLGGILGGFLYILAYNVFPVFQPYLQASVALGASAGVLAVLVAIATFVPNYTVRLFLLGEVQLKYIALISVILDVISIPNGNAGGHIAHIGGALYGFIYASGLKRGQNSAEWFERIIDGVSNTLNGWFSARSPLRPVFRADANRSNSYSRSRGSTAANRSSSKGKGPEDAQQRVDAILDKIKASGYSSLTAEEKRFLFDFSKR